VGTSTTSPYGGTWSNVAAGSYSLTAVATDGLGVKAASAPVVVTVTGSGGRTNVALATAGATASASSVYSSAYGASGTINGSRSGVGVGERRRVARRTGNTWPDWLEVDFAGLQTIDEVDVFSVQDAYTAPSTPTSSMTFSLYGVRDFAMQYWDGVGWTTVPGGTIVGNTLVWRPVTFAAVTTTKIRIYITNGANGSSRVTEVEVWGTAAGPANTPSAVTLTAPAANATYTAPGTIAWTATASDPDGISQVELYQGSTLVGTSTTSPYGGTWSNVAAGSYSLTAVATDGLGVKTASAPVVVTVTGSGGRTNVALALAGATASASSVYSNAYGASGDD